MAVSVVGLHPDNSHPDAKAKNNVAILFFMFLQEFGCGYGQFL
jgi:hypothetical protein